MGEGPPNGVRQQREEGRKRKRKVGEAPLRAKVEGFEGKFINSSARESGKRQERGKSVGSEMHPGRGFAA